jgi:hypothetical protein
MIRASDERPRGFGAGCWQRSWSFWRPPSSAWSGRATTVSTAIAGLPPRLRPVPNHRKISIGAARAERRSFPSSELRAGQRPRSRPHSAARSLLRRGPWLLLKKINLHRQAPSPAPKKQARAAAHPLAPAATRGARRRRMTTPSRHAARTVGARRDDANHQRRGTNARIEDAFMSGCRLSGRGVQSRERAGQYTRGRNDPQRPLTVYRRLEPDRR